MERERQREIRSGIENGGRKKSEKTITLLPPSNPIPSTDLYGSIWCYITTRMLSFAVSISFNKNEQKKGNSSHFMLCSFRFCNSICTRWKGQAFEATQSLRRMGAPKHYVSSFRKMYDIFPFKNTEQTIESFNFAY